ncbi:MAG: hypothetical protein AAF560_14130 [Acidobacteriota bacterium]
MLRMTLTTSAFILALVMGSTAESAQGQTELVLTTAGVGIGTDSPDADLDIESTRPTLRLTNAGPISGGWDLFANSSNGRLILSNLATGDAPFKVSQWSNHNLLRVGIGSNGLGVADAVSIVGQLQVQGSVIVDGAVVHPDYVFEPGYELESIAEHAARMWDAGHLPALPKAPEGGRGPLDLVSHQMGILEELEKAHIYIEQLHNAIHRLEGRIAGLESGATDPSPVTGQAGGL